jgi:rhodanese-related sulfurtransferase/DNA-binding transcriptional ArsR family regulator
MTLDAPAATEAHYGEIACIGKALGSPVRLRLLDLLRNGTRSVEDLAAAAGVSVANSSQHLQHLRAAGLVVGERRGQRVEYRLAVERVSTTYVALRELAEAIRPEMTRLGRDLGVLDPEERRALLRRIRRGEVTLVDVRPAPEYEAGHLPGALSIPVRELARRFPELPRDAEVVAYCRGPYCALAHEAVALLSAAGYRARHLDLGVADARALGVRVTGPPRPGRRRPRDRS